MALPFRHHKKLPSATDGLEESARQIRAGLNSAPRLNLGEQPQPHYPQQYPQPPQQPQQYPQPPQQPQQYPQPPQQPAPRQPAQAPPPQYNYPNPVPPQQQTYIQEDPWVAKMKRWLLIGLTAIIAGAAIMLIIWRIALKF